ncbi:MAG: hypothetical protein ACQETH_13560 [Candidatus Rifleibacteriota bacterium]
MAIPLVLGMVVVAGILGSTIWLSGRVGNRRVNQTINRLQLSSIAEAGISRGFSKIKIELEKGMLLKKIEISPFTTLFTLKNGEGSCRTKVEYIGREKFKIISTGRFNAFKSRSPSEKVMQIIAIAEVRTSTVQVGYYHKKFLKKYNCSLTIKSRQTYLSKK